MKNKSQLIRLLIITLSLLLCVSAFAACNKTPPDEPDNSTVSDVAEDSETEFQYTYDEDGYIMDRLPETLDFKGQNLNMLHWKSQVKAYVTEPGVDAISSALYYRVINVQDRLNCFISIKYEAGDWGTRNDFIAKVYNDVYSGTPTNDIISQYSFAAPIGTMYGLYKDLNEVEHIDFDMPWWLGDATESIEINGKVYFATGDISPDVAGLVYCMFFNADLLEKNNYGYTVDELYAEAINGTWTYEKMSAMVKNAYEDNGDLKRGSEDTFGLAVLDTPHYDAMFYSAGMRIVDKNEDGSYSLSRDWAGLKTATLVEQCAALFDSDDCVKADMESMTVFNEGRALLMLSHFQYAFALSQKANYKYGVLPLPKYDELQENYSTCLLATHSLYSVVYNTQKSEMAGAVMEALASDGYRNITPAVFEEGLKVKYSEDSNDAQIYDMVRDSVIFDIGRIWGDQIAVDWRYGFATFRDAVNHKSGWMTVVAGVQGGFVEDLNNILATIGNIEH